MRSSLAGPSTCPSNRTLYLCGSCRSRCCLNFVLLCRIIASSLVDIKQYPSSPSCHCRTALTPACLSGYLICVLNPPPTRRRRSRLPVRAKNSRKHWRLLAARGRWRQYWRSANIPGTSSTLILRPIRRGRLMMMTVMSSSPPSRSRSSLQLPFPLPAIEPLQWCGRNRRHRSRHHGRHGHGQRNHGGPWPARDAAGTGTDSQP